jgi:hypothetical protein
MGMRMGADGDADGRGWGTRIGADEGRGFSRMGDVFNKAVTLRNTVPPLRLRRGGQGGEVGMQRVLVCICCPFVRRMYVTRGRGWAMFFFTALMPKL